MKWIFALSIGGTLAVTIKHGVINVQDVFRYGDRIPKKFPGRLFAMFWILIGITITSMYIGALAGTIYSLRAPPQKNSLNGHIVGGLKHQLQDATIVAQHGGKVHKNCVTVLFQFLSGNNLVFKNRVLVWK